jgi:glucose-6-phosphate isomerase
VHTRGQQFQDGPRDKVVNNLLVRTARHPAVTLGMADRNEDDLNQFSRKGFPDLLDAAHKGATDAYAEVARPSADVVLPALTEHTVGQLLQMLMLATVVEGRLMGVNPYSQPGLEVYEAGLLRHLKATPNLPKGEVRDAAKGV